jgi:peptidoglycan hydrolase CwlO-like protein
VDFPIGFRQSDRQRLIRIEALLNSLLSKETQMATSLDNLTAEVTKLTSVGDGMETLLATLSTEIAGLKAGDPAQNAAIDALTAKIDAKAAEWSAAVVANTPAAGPTSVGPGASTPAG